METVNLSKQNRILKIAYFILLLLAGGFAFGIFYFFKDLSTYPDPEMHTFSRFFIPGLLAAAIIYPFTAKKKKFEALREVEPKRRLNGYFKQTIRSLAYALGATLMAAVTYSKTGNEMYLLYALVGMVVLAIQFPSDKKFEEVVLSE